MNAILHALLPVIIVTGAVAIYLVFLILAMKLGSWFADTKLGARIGKWVLK